MGGKKRKGKKNLGINTPKKDEGKKEDDLAHGYWELIER